MQKMKGRDEMATFKIPGMKIIDDQMKRSVKNYTPAKSTGLVDQVQAFQNNYQQGMQQKANTYQSPYAQQIQRTMNNVQNRPAFNYDINNDAVAQQGINNAVNSVSQAAARKNMLYSRSNKENMNQAALNAGQQFQNAAYNRYQDEGAQLYNKLQALMNLENNAYGQFRDTMSDNRYNDELTYNRGQQAQEIARVKALQDAQATGYYNPYYDVQVTDAVNPYASNYQAEINRRRSTTDTADDALIPQLEAARVNKVFASPDMLQRYGGQYRTTDAQMDDIARQVQGVNLQQQRYSLGQMTDPNSIQNRTAQTQYDLLANQARYAPQMSQNELALLQNQAKYAPQLSQAQLDSAYLDMNNTRSLIANRNAESSSKTTTGSPGYKDFYKIGLDMKKEAKYDDSSGNPQWLRRYSDDDVFNWIKALPISPEDKARLAGDLALPESVKPTSKNAEDIARKKRELLGTSTIKTGG